MQPSETPPNDNIAVEEISSGPRVRHGRSKIRKTGSLCWSLLLIAIFIFMGFQIGGLVRYIQIVTEGPPALDERADAIVVLTGGGNRIQAAMELLSQRWGKRLLVTGVNPDLSQDELRKIAGVSAELFNCCVDVDRVANDTVQNAQETTKWAKQNHARSIIVVTGAFHMPRALLELSHATKDIRLLAYPVNVPSEADWWRDAGRLRDLVREYAKLSVVRWRDKINWITGNSWPYMPMRDG